MGRDRIAVLVALTGVTAVAWAWLIRMAVEMDSPVPMAMMGVRAWAPVDFSLTLLMWTVMMVGMMVPTAVPMTLTYAAVGRKAARGQTPVPPTMVFAAGYVCLWALFSVVATLAQWGLDQTGVLSPMLVTTSPLLGSGLLVVAGAYQLTPYKRGCLDHCRSPAHFLSAHWKTGIGGAFRMGMEYGAFCIGCCWALMGLLFVGGVMNLAWVAAIAFFVLVEKLMPSGRLASAVGGCGLIGTGLFLMVFV
jgi:predicted metal-binding membrane protein